MTIVFIIVWKIAFSSHAYSPLIGVVAQVSVAPPISMLIRSSAGLRVGEIATWGEQDVLESSEKSSHTSNRPIIRLGLRSDMKALEGVGEQRTLFGPKGGFEPVQFAGDGALTLVGVVDRFESIKGWTVNLPCRRDCVDAHPTAASIFRAATDAGIPPDFTLESLETESERAGAIRGSLCGDLLDWLDGCINESMTGSTNKYASLRDFG